MRQGLFRREVVEARRSTWLGPIFAAAPLSRWTIALLAIGLASAIVCFLLFGHYTKRTRVSGVLVPSSGLLSLDANLSGTVSRIWVEEGQLVKADQPLVSISGDAISARLGDIHADIAHHLNAQRKRLELDRAALRVSLDERRTELQQQKSMYQEQLVQVREQQALINKRNSSDLRLLRRIEPLEKKGYVSAIQIEQQRARVLQGRVQVRDIKRQELELIQQITASRRELSQIPLDRSTQDNAIARKIDALGQQLAQNELGRSLVLRAPIAGHVSSVLVVQGHAVHPGEPLLSIVPEDAQLQAQLLVSSQVVGFIGPGSRVVLRYQSFPYQKFGQKYGRVISVSRSALSPKEIFSLTGWRANRSLYRVKVGLDSQKIYVNGKKQLLKPGMALDADILMERRTLFQWVFEPVYGLSQRLSEKETSHG